jgi:hypothetical protein
VKHSSRDVTAVVVTVVVTEVLAELDPVALAVELAVELAVLSEHVRKEPPWNSSSASFSTATASQPLLRSLISPVALHPNDDAGTCPRENSSTAEPSTATVLAQPTSSCSSCSPSSTAVLQSSDGVAPPQVSTRSTSLVRIGKHRSPVGCDTYAATSPPIKAHCNVPETDAVVAVDDAVLLIVVETELEPVVLAELDADDDAVVDFDVEPVVLPELDAVLDPVELAEVDNVLDAVLLTELVAVLEPVLVGVVDRVLDAELLADVDPVDEAVDEAVVDADELAVDDPELVPVLVPVVEAELEPVVEAVLLAELVGEVEAVLDCVFVAVELSVLDAVADTLDVAVVRRVELPVDVAVELRLDVRVLLGVLRSQTNELVRKSCTAASMAVTTSHVDVDSRYPSTVHRTAFVVVAGNACCVKSSLTAGKPSSQAARSAAAMTCRDAMVRQP